VHPATGGLVSSVAVCWAHGNGLHVVDDGAGGGGGHVMPTMNCAHIQQAKVNAAATADESTFFFFVRSLLIRVRSLARLGPHFFIS